MARLYVDSRGSFGTDLYPFDCIQSLSNAIGAFIHCAALWRRSSQIPKSIPVSRPELEFNEYSRMERGDHEHSISKRFNPEHVTNERLRNFSPMN